MDPRYVARVRSLPAASVFVPYSWPKMASLFSAALGWLQGPSPLASASAFVDSVRRSPILAGTVAGATAPAVGALPRSGSLAGTVPAAPPRPDAPFHAQAGLGSSGVMSECLARKCAATSGPRPVFGGLGSVEDELSWASTAPLKVRCHFPTATRSVPYYTASHTFFRPLCCPSAFSSTPWTL